ncbi:UNVERIFIED_CONTAM: hypothetical protein Cloal_0131 [Acetivibrio alkalicellulosi]
MYNKISDRTTLSQRDKKVIQEYMEKVSNMNYIQRTSSEKTNNTMMVK